MSTLPAAYLHHPSLHDQSIVFVADDDLWRVGASGGRAERLTDGLGEASAPCLSPDGRWLAYTGRDEGAPEVWLMPAAGGQARRMSWLGADTVTRGWTPDGRILFASNHGQPFFRNSHAFALSVQGGDPERLDCGQVDHLAFGPQGQRVIGRNTADPARWKRYRGGRVGQFWVDVEGRGEFRRMTELQGNPSHPMWLHDRVWFIGDAEGVGNLYSCRPDGSDLQRHTHHASHYARWAASDGQRIVYQCAAELWLFDPADGRTRRLEVEVPAARKQAARRLVAAAEHLQGWTLHPQGHSLALELRGQLHTMALWEGAPRRHDLGGPSRCRLGQWLADGRRLVGVSDAAGEERLQLFGDEQRALELDIGRVTAMVAAPVGARLALANHRNELLLVDVDAGTLRRLDHSEFGAMEGLAWSPDGAWLAYSCCTSMRHRAIRLCELAGGSTTLVSQPEFQDYSPAFDPEGRWLYFLSIRIFDPVYDAVQFELSFPRAARPYLVALQAGGRPPFEAEPRGMKKGDREARHESEAAAGQAPAGRAPQPLKVDLEGLQRRVAAFPVPENLFGRLAAAAEGKVLWTVLPVAGAHGRGGHKPGPGRLEVFDMASGRVQTLADKADHFELAGDHATVVLREGQRLRALGLEPRRDKEEAADEAPSRRSGWIDLERARVAVSPPDEWRQMLREAWRLQRDQFWVEDMSGNDWQDVWARYAPLLERVATRGELSDLMWELQGELGTSHAYEYGGDHRKPPVLAGGLLAADLRHGDDGAEILHIVRGDPWDAAADSPLHAVGVEARAGERITAVGGLPVSRAQPVGELLLQRAGGKVELTLADGERLRQVLVRPLADEVPARYREWVERQRAWVHLQSGGRVGYFHVPDMMSAGFAEFHRYFATECDRDALIVDVRYNRGGHVSQLLLEKVARRRIAWATQRRGQPTPYPEAAPAGPVVALTNEHAGSDGDIFSHGFKLMGIGELVGQRTWGGVIGIWPRHPLVDGSTVTQPEYSYWFKDVGWQVENHGTDPTIAVENRPQDAAAGRDRQLEVALQTALQALERHGVDRPEFGPRPRLAAPPLPG
jgi:tricorn protease